MIEARATWVLEGPDDSITFSPAGPFTITEKPKTAVDDRRDTYDYPLDDGAYVGDAYAGHRVWSLKGILVASSHADRNEKMQQLSALLNSLRRADGLLKWTPDGFDPVQSTVRRMGSVDFGGGANLHVPFSFSLIAGDPRVYSQTEHTDSVVPASESLGSNVLTANQEGIETSAAGWQSHARAVLAQSATQAHSGTKSLRLNPDIAGRTAIWIVQSGVSPVTGGVPLRCEAWFYSTVADVSIDFISLLYNNGGSTFIGGGDIGSGAAVTQNVWTKATFDFTPDAAATHFALQIKLAKAAGLGLTDYIYVDDAKVRHISYSAEIDIINAGDSDTPGIFAVTGPAGDPTLTNSLTAESMPLEITVAAATTLTVDSGNREIYLGPSLAAGSNQYSAKTASAPFLSLPPGTSPISMLASGTTGATELEVRWRDAWMP